MSTKKTGGMAFPLMSHTDCHGYRHEREEGISKRDYFAAQALVGLLASPSVWAAEQAHGVEGIAAVAFVMADAMLKERAK
jgi:hypothetical protein